MTDTRADRDTETDPDRTEAVRIDAGNDLVELVLVDDGGGPLRVGRLGRPGIGPDLPIGRPVVEVITVDAGRAPSTPRMVGGVASARMRYVRHDERQEGAVRVVEVLLREPDGLEAVLAIRTRATVRAATVAVTVRNRGTASRIIRSVASLVTRVGGGPDDLVLASATNAWVGESRWHRRPVQELLVDLAHDAHDGGAGRACHAETSFGTWSTGTASPIGVLEGRDGALMWQIEHNGGWRWEIGDDPEGAYLAAGGPNEGDHHWSVTLGPDDAFTTVPVTVAVGADLTGVVASMTAYRRASRRPHPDRDALPVVFNDYMNTLMGDPTEEKLLPLIEQASEAGAEVFCIDAGWYDETGDWWDSVGEWKPSRNRFPNGIDAVLDHIRDRDMVPGLWLEPEVIGVASPLADILPDAAFLTLHGQRIVEHGRYHLDLTHPEARAHVDAVVDRLVLDHGIGYFKLDYNINPGAGTDRDGDAVGAGLLRHQRAHLAWLDGVLDRHPHVVFENCASGAMRSDWAMLQRLQLQSTSDQQDPVTYVPIAAAAPMTMLPEQAGNWAYPQPDMDDEAIAFALCTGMLGRMYLSGRLDAMTPAQRMLVADGVAAHKHVRHAVADGDPAWPLGLDQWAGHWVAASIEAPETTLVTVWRRPGAGESVRLSIPALAGRAVTVETVFPTRLTPWVTEWDADAGALVVRTDGRVPAARTFRLTVGVPVDVVEIDASAVTGPVHGGATGMLYGLGDGGALAPAVIAGARPRTLAQKAPGGRQHPNGDAFDVAGDFFAAGGRELLVYMQDHLRAWPYEEDGIDAYVELVRAMVGASVDREDRDRLVWVPFNEPDWIWYADWSTAGRARFLSDWTTVFRAIRDVDPRARIAGPNESRYHPARVRDFLRYAVDEDVVPDVMSWHELQPSSLELWPAHIAHYRELERSLAVGPLPINIDEYGNRRDMAVPARLLRWASLFEGSKVDADLAYWTLAGNLDDQAVGVHEGNGGWWLLHWYSALGGETVQLTSVTAGVRDGITGVAAVDDGVLTALVTGSDRPIELRVTGLRDDRLQVLVERTDWSGTEGALDAPAVVSHDVVSSIDGCVTVRVEPTDVFAAVRVLFVPAGTDAAPGPATDRAPVQRRAADTATGADVDWSARDQDAQQYAGSGTRGVRAMPSATSTLTFDVDVPPVPDVGGPPDPQRAVVSRLSLVYGTDGLPGVVGIAVDDGPTRTVPLAATLDPEHTGRTDLGAIAPGRHQVVLRRGDAPPRSGDVAIDALMVRAEPQVRRYPALAARHGGVRVGDAVLLGAEDAIDVFVGTAVRGEHAIAVDADGGTVVTVDGVTVPDGAVIALPRGIVHCRVTGAGARVRAVVVEDRTDAQDPETDLEVVVRDGVVSAASPGPGRYLLTIAYANGDRVVGHEYNADVVSRFGVVGCDGHGRRVVFPNTVHADEFRDRCVVLDVPVDARAVTIVPDDGPGPVVRSMTVRPLLGAWSGRSCGSIAT